MSAIYRKDRHKQGQYEEISSNVLKRESIGSLSNCSACHQTAAFFSTWYCQMFHEKLTLDTPCGSTGFFTKDGLKLSFVDGHIHENELIWLKAVAETNGLEDKWYDDSVKAAADQGSGDLENILEAKYLEWE